MFKGEFGPRNLRAGPGSLRLLLLVGFFLVLQGVLEVADTFSQTFDQMVDLATKHPDRNFAVLVRPHPTDPHADELFQIANRETPPNLVVRRATNDVVTMQEATYGADVTASIVGTDNFLAPRRGRQGVFLGYEGPGMGGALLDKLYGREIVGLLERGDRLAVSRTPKSFHDLIESLTPSHGVPDVAEQHQTSVERILDEMLGKPADKV